MDQKQNPTQVGRNHLTGDFLPLMLLSVSPSPLRSFQSRSPGLCNVQAWVSSTTEVIFFQVILQMTNFWAVDVLLLPLTPSQRVGGHGEGTSLMKRCLVMEPSTVPGKKLKEPRTKQNKTTE
jgi:hypothetical protein